MELLAKEQVLDDKALMAVAGGDERGQKEPEELEHRRRIADQLCGRSPCSILPPYRSVGRVCTG